MPLFTPDPGHGRVVGAIFTAALVALVSGFTPKSEVLLSPELRAIIEAPAYASARWGLEVVDLASGEVIYTFRSSEKFLTASTAKIFSVTTALAVFGPDHRFETSVFHTGDGDLILRAAGDLTLGGRTRPDGTVDTPNFDHYDADPLPGVATLTSEDPLAGLNDLARQVRKAGIVRVAGDVLVDDRLWAPVEKDGVPISPMVVNDNLIDFVLTPGASAAAPAAFAWRPKTAAFVPDVKVTTGAKGSRIQVQITAPAPGRIMIRGSVPAGAAPVVQTYQVPDPAAFARTAFIEALARASIRLHTAFQSRSASRPARSAPTRRGSSPRRTASRACRSSPPSCRRRSPNTRSSSTR